jgi:hypothetical protein
MLLLDAPNSRLRHDISRQHREGSHHPPSPPPIATLTQSPSLSSSSLDRSTVSTPAPVRPSPQDEPLHLQSMYPPYSQHPYSRPPKMHYPDGYPSTVHHPYPYSHLPALDLKYDQFPQQAPPLPPPFPLPHLNLPSIVGTSSGSFRSSFSSSPYPGRNTSGIVYTDDAATKLSDRVRRRCFNCCTTDTSTWRRSNLSPGKVVSFVVVPLLPP